MTDIHSQSGCISVIAFMIKDITWRNPKHDESYLFYPDTILLVYTNIGVIREVKSRSINSRTLISDEINETIIQYAYRNLPD